ncbi:MAG: septation protein IspZ [Bdellovibrionota bacterium]
MTSTSKPTPQLSERPSAKGQALSLLFGGLLPVIAYTVIEEKYGPKYGLIAGLIFGGGEIIYELVRYKKVSLTTWIGNGLLLGLGAISLFFNDGIWFKLQPAMMEFGMFVFLLGSWALKKPFLQIMAEKQNPQMPPLLKNNLGGMTFRLSFFFLAHAIIATYAAYYWSTEAWAWLKGIGLIVSMILYMIAEMFFIRLRLNKK